MIEEIHVFISGQVQGVGFRARVARYALKHNIKGFVRNLPDERVEICAQGAGSAIRAFFKEIRAAPGRALIQSFDEKKTECGQTYSAFEIY